MKPVKPSKKTTLVLTAAFQPYGFFTARSAIHHMVTDGVRAVDVDGAIFNWKEWNKKESELGEDHPSLRSASSEWAVPTIVVIPGFFGKFNKKKKRNTRTSNLRQIYNVYESICQYCLNEIPFSKATKDHTVPKSKGGVNYDSNIVLACKKCNSKKSNNFPYFNVKGEEVKPKMFDDIEYFAKADRIEMRPEWLPYLGIEK